MPPTDRQRVTSALRMARTYACVQAHAMRPSPTSPYRRGPVGTVGDALCWLRVVRSLEAVPLDSPRCLRFARAALTVLRATDATEAHAMLALRALRGYSHYDNWRRRMGPGRIPG